MKPAGLPSPATLGAPEQHLPSYVRNGFDQFRRQNVVGIAEREWRGFGSIVDDSSPGTNPLPRSARPDQQPGLWQRVGDYWWGGQDFGALSGGWSSRFNESGTEYSNGAPAWSAAFISYVMRTAGAGPRFVYSPLHADYINAAARGEGALRAERPETYAPKVGDLICYGRQGAQGMHFDDLPANRFFGHCDVVVAALPGQLRVIGGNVSSSVTLKHVPTTSTGMLAEADGRLVDTRYPWFVVLNVSYDG